MDTNLGWVEFYLGLALAVSRKSKDSTKHGCVITDQEHRILGLGFNGPPRGFPDGEMPTHREHDNAPNKYDMAIHAERNAIDNCSVAIHNGIAYVTGIACPPCLRDLYQNGVRVVYMVNRTSNMLSERDTVVSNFIVEQSKKSKYGELKVYHVIPDLSWLHDIPLPFPKIEYELVD